MPPDPVRLKIAVQKTPADLLYHTVLLLKIKSLSLSQVIAELESRHAREDRPPHDVGAASR